MSRTLAALALTLFAVALPVLAENKAPGHYLFAWTGDAALKGNDFLAVIDADPASSTYGKLITTVATDQQTVRIHHTEYVMPASGMLFANDHDVGRTFIFDVNDPLHPKVATSFTDMDGYMHPHSFVRLPNGHVLATFQHTHHGKAPGQMGATGGLVEIDDSGHVIRSASNADPAFADALLMPYGLLHPNWSTPFPATGAACQRSWAISLWKASRRFTASSSWTSRTRPTRSKYRASP
jgi:hypothetical protein